MGWVEGARDSYLFNEYEFGSGGNLDLLGHPDHTIHDLATVKVCQHFVRITRPGGMERQSIGINVWVDRHNVLGIAGVRAEIRLCRPKGG